MGFRSRNAMLFLPLAVAFCAILAQPVLADAMTGAEITAQIIDKDLVTQRAGMTVHLRYDPDGSVTVRAPLFSGRGRWTLAGGTLCMTLTEGPRRGETCHTFEGMGADSYRNSEGQILQQQ